MKNSGGRTGLRFGAFVAAVYTAWGKPRAPGLVPLAFTRAASITSRITLTVGLMSLVGSLSASAGIMATWDFTTAATGPLSNYGASSHDTHIAITPGLTTSGGSVVPSVAGGVLNYNYGGNHADQLNSCTLTLALIASTASYNGLSVSFTDAVSGGLTALTGQWSYWVGTGTPGTFTSIGSPVALVPGSTPLTTLTGIGVSAGQTLELQFVMSGAADGNNGGLTFGNLHVDAAGITPVPEPVNVALGTFAGVFGVVIVVRNRSARHQVQRCRAAVNHWLDAV